jgi:hypothetical protein
MAAPAQMFATVLYLESGHVVTALSTGGPERTIEELTGEDGVRVRLPDDPGFVKVPMSALTAKRVAVTADVLDRALAYVVGSGNPPLRLGVKPVYGTPASPGAAGTKAVVVWQDGEDSVVVSGVLGSGGAAPGTAPPGATHQLLAWENGPINVKSL